MVLLTNHHNPLEPLPETPKENPKHEDVQTPVSKRSKTAGVRSLTYTWTNNGSNGNDKWDDANNWSVTGTGGLVGTSPGNNGVTSDSVVFNGTNGDYCKLPSTQDIEIRSLTITSAYTNTIYFKGYNLGVGDISSATSDLAGGSFDFTTAHETLGFSYGSVTWEGTTLAATRPIGAAPSTAPLPSPYPAVRRT